MSGIAFRQHHQITTVAPLVANSTADHLQAGSHHHTRSTSIPVYLTDLIKNYHPSRTLQSADKIVTVYTTDDTGIIGKSL